MIIVEPVRDSELPTGADVRARTKAYVGIKIIVINYDIYQDSENYNDRHKGRPSFPEGHNNNKGTIKDINILSEISVLRERYSDPNLIDQVFRAIACTRKTGKVSDSVLLAQLQKWALYSVEQVESAIRIYLEKNYVANGKRESYLLGIIRNQKSAAIFGSSFPILIIDKGDEGVFVSIPSIRVIFSDGEYIQ